VHLVFDGAGCVRVGDRNWKVGRGDLFVVPSWTPFSARASGAVNLDLFCFGDAPIFEALHVARINVDASSSQR
jgi:gentisate 1,2-dioxygenase